MKYTLALMALFLCSCASIKPQPFTSPNNKEAYTMKCSGFGRTWHKCYNKASEVCPAGYNIISKNSEAHLVNGNLINRREFAIECK